MLPGFVLHQIRNSLAARQVVPEIDALLAIPL